MDAHSPEGPARTASRLTARWALPVVWLSLPFTLGPAIADALATWDEQVQRIDSGGAWLLWLTGLVSTFVVSTVSLTANRVLGPAALVAALATLVGGATGTTAIVAISIGLAATIVALNRSVADCYANGSSYGDERRFLLRTPAPLLIGPVELAVVLVIAGVCAGPMLLASSNYVVGAVSVVVGWPLALVLLRSLHGLSRRWLVFVPAGMVVHDSTALVDNLLVQRKDVASIGWAPADTDAHDLTAGGLGRIVQITFRQPQSYLRRPARRPGTEGPAVEPIDAAAVLVAPTRGKATLAEAATRRLTISS